MRRSEKEERKGGAMRRSAVVIDAESELELAVLEKDMSATSPASG